MSALDLAIVALYLAGVVAAGWLFSRRQKTTAQYFLGGRAVPWWAIAASIVATETSTITFVSVPGIAYARGGDFTFLQLVFGYLAGRVAITLLFLPSYFSGDLLTVYQLLETRFGRKVKALAAALFVTTRTVGDGIRLLLTALVLGAVYTALRPGADADLAVVSGVVVLGFVMILFTLWGGMEAVIWIEVVQLGIYLLGAIAALLVLTGKVPGGLPGAVALGETFGKLRVFDFSFAGAGSFTTFWAGLAGGCFLTMSTHGTDQYLVQRYLCTDSPRKAGAALLTSGLVVLLQFVLFLTIGLLLFAFYRPFEAAAYASGPAASPFARPDAVFPDFITRHLGSPLAGLVVAAILAAALSSSLNSIAGAVLNDLWRPFRAAVSDAEALRFSKSVTLAAGVAQVGVALAVRGSGQSALGQALSVAALVNGPILGVFLLGTFDARSGPRAGLVGMAAGAAVALWVFAATKVAWPWYTAIGSLSTLAAGFVAARAAAAGGRPA